MNESFFLSGSDKSSNVWAKLMGHFEDRLQTLRIKNDGELSPEATAHMRGRIAEIRSLMSLDKDPIVLDMPIIPKF